MRPVEPERIADGSDLVDERLDVPELLAAGEDAFLEVAGREPLAGADAQKQLHSRRQRGLPIRRRSWSIPILLA